MACTCKHIAIILCHRRDIDTDSDSYASHTGAGLYDPVFDVNKTVGSVGQLDNGHQAFDVGTNTAELSMMYAPYAAWAGVAMNLGDGDSGYYLNENGLQWTSSPESPGGSTDSFKGWLGK